MTAFFLVRHGTPQYALAEERRLRGGMRDWVPLTAEGVVEAALTGCERLPCGGVVVYAL